MKARPYCRSNCPLLRSWRARDAAFVNFFMFPMCDAIFAIEFAIWSSPLGTGASLACPLGIYHNTVPPLLKPT
eukprot:286005-Pyramimonas_sp.AAC.2